MYLLTDTFFVPSIAAIFPFLGKIESVSHKAPRPLPPVYIYKAAVKHPLFYSKNIPVNRYILKSSCLHFKTL
jgi:hypothetical protein